MTNDKPTDALVDGVRSAVVHFGKAAYEVASGVGALVVGIAHTVRPDHRDEDDGSGPERVPVE